MSSDIVRIFAVEDHPVMRQTLHDLIEAAPAFVLHGMARSAEETLATAAVLTADVVLVDLSLPGKNGIELIDELLARKPALCCLVLTGHMERAHVRRALAAGARGYVLKGDPDQLMEAIRAVASGETYLSPLLAGRPAEEGG